MNFERSAFSSIHPEVPPLFTQDGGAVISRMMTTPMIWENPRIDLDTQIIDEGVVWHIQRGGVDNSLWNHVLCHLTIETEYNDVSRAFQVSIGRKQPIFAIRDTRVCTIALSNGWSVTYTAMFDEDLVPASTLLPARISKTDSDNVTHISAMLFKNSGEERYDLNMNTHSTLLSVNSLTDLHLPSRPATDAEIEVFTLGHSFIGCRDMSVRDVAIRGADGTNWPQWKNPFAE